MTNLKSMTAGQRFMWSLKQFLIAMDQLFNTLLGGWSDETLSARAYRNRDKSKAWFVLYQVLNTIFFWEHDHCESSYNSEVIRKHLPEDYHYHGR